MGAVIVALRPGDHKALAVIGARWGRSEKEVAAILLEKAIRREEQTDAPLESENITQAMMTGPGGM